MTDIVIGVTLRADGKSFVGEVRNAKVEVEGLGTAGVRAGAGLDDLGARASRAIAPLRSVAAALTAIGAGFTVSEAVEAFAEYEKGLVGVAKTANLTESQVRDMDAAITDMARRLPFSRKELLEIAQAGGQLGVQGVKDLTLFTDTIAKLGSASDLSGEAAATALTRILNVTGEGIERIDTFASVIVALGNNFAASESEIASVATQVAQATAQFHVSSDQVAGLAAALRSVGVQAELGGSTVGVAFRQIDAAIRGGGEQLKLLQQLTGLTGDQLRQTFQTDAAAVFQAFVEGLGRTIASGGSAADTLARLGLQGDEVLKVLPTLAQRSDEVGRALQLAGNEARNATALQTEFERAAATLSAELERTGNTLNELAVAFGKALAPEVAEASAALREFVQASIDSGSAERTFEAVASAVGLVVNNLDLLGGVAAVAALTRLQPVIVAMLGSVNSLTPALAANAAQWVQLNAAVAAGTAVDLSSAAATAQKAEAQAASAAQALVAAQATEKRAASELANAAAIRATIASELRLQQQIVQSNVVGAARTQAVERLIALRAEEATAAQAVAAAEGRLATAQAATAASARAAAVATEAHVVAMAASTATARAAAVANRLMAGALGLVGGPAGAAVLAAGAIYLLATHESTAETASKNLAAATETLNRLTASGVPATSQLAEAKLKEAEASQAAARATLAELDAQIALKSQQRTFGKSPGGAAGLEIYKQEAADLRRNMDELQASIDALRATADDAGTALDQAGEPGVALANKLGQGATVLSDEIRALIDQLDPLGKRTREAADAEAKLRAAWTASGQKAFDLTKLLDALKHGQEAYNYQLGAAARAARDQARDIEVQAQVRALESERTDEARRKIIELKAARELEKLEIQRVQAVMAAQPGQIDGINAAYDALRLTILRVRDADLVWSEAQASSLHQLEDGLDPVAAKYREVDEQTRLLAAALDAGKISYEQYIELLERLGDKVNAWADAQHQAARQVADNARDLELSNEVRRLELENTDEARRKIIELTTARKLEQLGIERTRALLAATPEQYDEINAAYDRLRKAIEDEGAVQQLERLREQANPLVRAFQNAADGIQKGFADAITGFVEDGKFKFKDLLSTWKSAFARMLGELATLALARPIIIPAVTAIGQTLGLSSGAINGVTANFGGSGGAGNLLSSGKSIFDLFNGGGSGGLYNTFANSGIGQLFGLSYGAGSLATDAGLFAAGSGALSTFAAGGSTALALTGPAGGFGSLAGLAGTASTGGAVGAATAGGSLAASGGLTGIGSAIGTVAPYALAALVAIQLLSGSGLFGGNPSSGPVGIADFSPGLGRANAFNVPGIDPYTSDNGGDGESLKPIAEAIADLIANSADQFDATINQSLRFRVANYSGPESGSGRVAGFEVNAFINGEAEKRIAEGKTQEEAIFEALKFAVTKAFDFESDTVAEAAANSAATTTDELLANLNYAQDFDNIINAINENGGKIDANTLAIARDSVNRDKAADDWAAKGGKAIVDALAKARELFPAIGSDASTTTTSAIGDAIRSIVLESDHGAIRGQTADFQFVGSGSGRADEPSYIRAGDKRYDVQRVAADNREGVAFNLVDETGKVIEQFDTMTALLAGAGAALADYNDQLAAQADTAGRTAEEQARTDANRKRVSDAVDIAKASVDQLIGSVTGGFVPAVTGPVTEALQTGTAELQALAPYIEQVNDEIRQANETFPDLGASVYDVTATITDAVQELQQKALEDFYSGLTAQENASRGYGAINGLDALITNRDQLLADADTVGADAADRILGTFQRQVRSQLDGLDVEGLSAALQQTTDEAARAVIQSMIGEASSAANEAQLASYRDEVTAAYQREADALASLRDRMYDFASSIRSFLDKLAIGDLAPGGPAVKLATARQQFDEIYRRAQLGDENAIAGLTAAAQSFLEASRAFNGDEPAYTADYNETVSRLQNVETLAQRQARIADEQLSALQTQVSQFVTLNESVLSVADAIARLQAAMTAGDQAQSNGYQFGQAVETNKYIYNKLVEAGLPTPEGFGPDVAHNLNWLRANDARVDAYVTSLGFEGGGWHQGGLARIHNDELIYTGPPIHVFNAKESAALMMARPSNDTAAAADLSPVVGAIGQTTSAIVSAGDRQVAATVYLSDQVQRLERRVADQSQTINDLTTRLGKVRA